MRDIEALTVSLHTMKHWAQLSREKAATSSSGESIESAVAGVWATQRAAVRVWLLSLDLFLSKNSMYV